MIAPPHLIIFTRETKPGTHKPIRFLVPFAISFIADQCNDDKLNKAIFCIILYYVCIAILFLFPNGRIALVKFGMLLFSHQNGISLFVFVLNVYGNKIELWQMELWLGTRNGPL